jgi:Flp pilus assembly protein TadD
MHLRSRFFLATGVVFLAAGCAQTGKPSADAVRAVEPVYRVGQPAGSAEGQYAMGREALAAGRYHEAIRRFRLTLELNPSFVEAHNGLGVAFG